MTTPNEVLGNCALGDAMATVCTPVSGAAPFDDSVAPDDTAMPISDSLSPSQPTVPMALHRERGTLRVGLGDGYSGVGVLASEQETRAAVFAISEGAAKFESGAPHLDEGVPQPRGAATVRLRLTVRVVDGGHNPIRLGEVLAAENADSPPATYQRRVVGVHAAPGRRP